MEEQQKTGEALFDKLSQEKKQRRRKRLRRVIIIVAVIFAALVMVVSHLRKNVDARFAATQKDVQSCTVAPGTIHTLVSGSGVLEQVDEEDVTVPAGVEVDEVIAEVLPEEKAGVVERLQSQGRKVMMVGDGINDAPALTAATVGCAIGSGSDIAIESADIVLMRSDLEDVPRALRLSALTLRDIKQNLFWAFCYNTVGIPIAAGLLYAFGGPLLSPMFAGAAMSLSSVCVVGNALRLGTVKL